MSRRTLVNLIFFVAIFALMIFWAVNNIITVDSLERPYTITGDFEQTAGVSANAEVTYLGVNYGRVSGTERTPEGVRVTMKIDRDKDIPAGAIARVFRKSAIGEPYIDFVPPDSYTRGDTARIEPGENVPLERTTVPLEFSDLLRSASALVSSIDPEEAGSLLHELSLALEGRGESLRTITTSIDRLTATFVERTEQLDRLAENNTRITGVLADHRLSLGRSIQNLRAVAETLRRADGDTQALLEVGPEFLRTTADLVADQKQNLDCLLSDLDPILRTLNRSQSLDDLAQLLQKGPVAFGYAAAAVDHEPDGPWVRINLMVTLEGEDPEVYVPPKTLPVVPSVPSCSSPLTPAGVFPAASASEVTGAGSTGSVARPAAPTAGGGGVAPAPSSEQGPSGLAATGGFALLASGLLCAAAALGTWRLHRRGGRVHPGPPSD